MSSTRKIKPSLTAVRKVLREAQFNPREPGTMKIVAEQGSPEYYLHSAIVAIEQAKTHSGEQYINQAIRLLTLARIYNEQS